MQENKQQTPEKTKPTATTERRQRTQAKAVKAKKGKFRLPFHFNFWKAATLILIGLIFGTGFYVNHLLNANREANYKAPTYDSVDTSGTQVLSMETNKVKVNLLIEHYLSTSLLYD